VLLSSRGVACGGPGTGKYMGEKSGQTRKNQGGGEVRLGRKNSWEGNTLGRLPIRQNLERKGEGKHSSRHQGEPTTMIMQNGTGLRPFYKKKRDLKTESELTPKGHQGNKPVTKNKGGGSGRNGGTGKLTCRNVEAGAK